MDWQINCVKPPVIGGVMVSVMQAVIVTVQLAVVAWMELMVQPESLVAHELVMQYVTFWHLHYFSNLIKCC